MSIYMQLTYKTKFTDLEILKKALTMCQLKYSEKDGVLACDNVFYEFYLKKNKNGEFDLQVYGYDDWQDEILQLYKAITTKYEELAKKQIQKEILDNIKNKLLNYSSMKLMQEEVLDDNSIVLTVSVQ